MEVENTVASGWTFGGYTFIAPILAKLETEMYEYQLGVAMAIPNWLARLRRQEIIEVVQNHPNTRDGLVLKLSPQEIIKKAICGGQADFDAPYRHLNGTERALLYAFFNQPG